MGDRLLELLLDRFLVFRLLLCAGRDELLDWQRPSSMGTGTSGGGLRTSSLLSGLL